MSAPPTPPVQPQPTQPQSQPLPPRFTYTSKTVLDIKPSTIDAINKHGANVPPKEFLPITPAKEESRVPNRPEAHKRKRYYPGDAPPKSLLLPFVRVSDEVADKHLSYVETDSFTRNNIMSMLRRRKGKIDIPGWLVQVSDERMNGIMDIEKALKSPSSDPEALVATIHTIINDQMGITVTKDEICDTLDAVKDSTGSISFSKFLLAIANPVFAQRCHGVLTQPIKTREEASSKCHSTGDHMSSKSSSVSGSSGASTKKKKADDTSPTSQSDPRTGYSERERIFYSGLLVTQMADTLAQVEDVYFKAHIPETVEQRAKREAAWGFGMDSIGVRKIGKAEWERGIPESKQSPYLSTVPFVTYRWRVTKPNQDEKGRRRTLNELYPMHLTVLPPEPEHVKNQRVEFRGPIRITENRIRIKQALEYLAATGDCVAHLPDIFLIIHLSDTFVDKLEEVSMKPPKSATRPKRINVGTDVSSIAKQALQLHVPHGMPKPINKIKRNIKYTTAIQLRKIVAKIHEGHWEYLKSEAKLFSLNCWQMMHIERMKDGVAKNSFINAFVTYLPHPPGLPLGNLNSSLPL